MAFDECTPFPVEKKIAEKSMKLSSRWAERSKASFKGSNGSMLFGIQQGGMFEDLREESARNLNDIGFDGYAIGGLAVGEPQQKMFEVLDYSTDFFSKDKPRYLMGVGKPDDIIGAIKRGVDMFDCVLPTRSGRTGLAFTWQGRVNIKNNKYQNDNTPLDPECKNLNLNKYSKNYLNHLFNTNEILVSLMLVYVSKLLLDYLVVGPWSNPEGFNFPETRQFSDSSRMPLLFEGLRIHAGIFLALAAVMLSWFILYKTYLGFQIKVSGLSLKTAKYAGFKGKTMILVVFMISGACAGLAGVGEITGPIGQLHRMISPDYGFTAIIVAFLGRLNPFGIIFASLVVALTYLGAETAQIFLQIPKYTGQVFQGMILFFLLASDYLLFFKIKILNLKKNELRH